jgi:hypothetical protein
LNNSSLRAQNFAWVEDQSGYFDAVPNYHQEAVGYLHFMSGIGDINGDGLADIAYMWKQWPVRPPGNPDGGDLGFATTYPGFNINRGTLDNPEWDVTCANWGMWWLNEKPGETTVPTIVDWNKDGFGDLFVGERDVEVSGFDQWPPVYRQIADPNYVAIKGFDWRHYYFQEQFVDSFEKLQPLLVENFLMNPAWWNRSYNWASPAIHDIDNDGDWDIVIGQNLHKSPNMEGRVMIWRNEGNNWNLLTLYYRWPNEMRIANEQITEFCYDEYSYYDYNYTPPMLHI